MWTWETFLETQELENWLNTGKDVLEDWENTAFVIYVHEC